MILNKRRKKKQRISFQLLAKCQRFLILSAAPLLLATNVSAQHEALGNSTQFQQDFSFKGKFNGAIVVVGQPSEANIIQNNLSRVVADAELFYNLLDSTNPSGEVASINANRNKVNVQVSQLVMNALKTAKDASKWTNGVFDFVVSNGNYKSVSIDEKNSNLKFKDPSIEVNLDPIMKGIMADYIISSLQTVNIVNAIVRIGNVFKAVGQSKLGPWIIQVQADSGSTARRALNFKLSNTGIATESISDFKSRPLMNYQTKSSVPPNCRGVTLAMSDAATAQGIAYAVMVLGPDDGMKLLKRLGKAYGFIVDLNGNFLKTPGL